MGETTYVKMNSSQQAAKKPRPLNLSFDVPMLIAVSCLIIFGLLMVYSASWSYVIRAGLPDSYLLQRQVIWVGVGIIAATVLSLIDYHEIARWALPMMGVTLFLLFVVLWAGDANSTHRTLFKGSVQPSELVKVVLLIYLSVWINSKKDQMKSIWFGLIPLGTILGITAGLIVLEPDISAAMTVFLLGGLIFFIGGGDLRQITIILVVGLILGAIIVAISPTGQNRISDYTSGLADPNQASYHVQRAFEAVVRGGFFGVGIGKGVTKFTGLPFPWTDSIFAVVVEETGLLGGAVTIFLYLLILWRGIKIANNAPDFLGKLMASGLTLWIITEAIINIGVMVNLVPFAGNALPLMSSGGSNMVTTLASLGIVMNIGKRSNQKESPANPTNISGRSYSATVDLRGRNRRRSISGTRRSSSTRF